MFNRFGMPLVTVFAVQMVAMSPVFSQVAQPAAIKGLWQAEDGSMKIDMFDAGGGNYAGRLIYGRRAVEADGKTFKRDVRNPDAKLRARSLEGITILNNLKWNAGNRRFEGGTLYDGTSGRTYSARVTIIGEKMELRGYMGSPLLGRTITFNRAARDAVR